MAKRHEISLYNWQHKSWPNFTFDYSGIQPLIYHYLLEAGMAAGGLKQLAQAGQSESEIDFMVMEASNSSKIEGENINIDDIRSSIRKELGLPSPHQIKDARAAGIAKLMVSLNRTFREPLTEHQLFKWHDMMMSDPKQRRGIDIGKWRTDLEPMQIVSGAMGQEKVHFEAPPQDRVPEEMTRFIDWFNSSQNTDMPGLVRAAIAHIYFESIHPFADGNGRIGRAISDKALAQELGCPAPFSLSVTIQKGKRVYYDELSKASRCHMDITRWITYFARTVSDAQIDGEKTIQFVINKAKFWQRFGQAVNERQESVLAKMFAAGAPGFIGGMSASKYATIAKCSKATATRDLTDLCDLGCLKKLPLGGRSTRYELAI